MESKPLFLKVNNLVVGHAHILTSISCILFFFVKISLAFSLSKFFFFLGNVFFNYLVTYLCFFHSFFVQMKIYRHRHNSGRSVAGGKKFP